MYKFYAFPGLGNAVVGRRRLRGVGSRIIENAWNSMHFLVWVMLWWGAGGSRVIKNAKSCMLLPVWVMLWWGVGGSRITENVNKELYAFPGLSNAVVGRRRLQNH